MQASELDFDLPQDLIAQAPLAERDGARLAIIDQHEGLQEHARILDLPNAIRPSLIIVNDSKVLRARIFTKKPSGGKAELLHLPARGLRGNTHIPFADLNNAAVADLLAEFLHKNGLDRQQAK